MKKILGIFFLLLSAGHLTAPTYVFAQDAQVTETNWTEQEIENARHFLSSLNATNTGSRIIISATSSPFDGTRQEKLEELRKISQKAQPYYKKALEEGRLVRDEVLDKMHPQLKKHFREEYIKSLGYITDKAENNEKDMQQPTEGSLLYRKWAAWLTKHVKDLDIPLELTKK